MLLHMRAVLMLALIVLARAFALWALDLLP